MGRAVPGRGARRRRLRDGHRRADRLPVGPAHRHLLRDGDPGLRADDLLHRQPVARRHRRRERPAGHPARPSSASSRSRPTRSTSTTRRSRSSCSASSSPGASSTRPFGRVLVAIRDNPARARALGYDVERYKIMAFVLSAGLAGSRRWRLRDQPRVRLAAGAGLDDLGQGRAHHGPRRHRHPLGRPGRRRRSSSSSRTSWPPPASRGSASSPARSSWSSCCSSATASGARPATASTPGCTGAASSPARASRPRDSARARRPAHRTRWAGRRAVSRPRTREAAA